MNKIIGITLVVVLAVFGVWALLLRGGSEKPTDNTPASTTSQSPAVQPAQSEQPEQTGDETTNNTQEETITIVYTNNGFSPQNYTVKAGSRVTVRNDADRQLDFASDPHPAHTDNMQLNTGSIRPGASRTFEPTRTGTWGFHNHDRATHFGTIKVE